MNKIVIELHPIENGFEEYGELSMIIKGRCGGIYSWKDAINEIKQAYHSLNKKKEIAK